MFFIPAHQIQGRCHYPPAGPHQPPEIIIIINIIIIIIIIIIMLDSLSFCVHTV